MDLVSNWLSPIPPLQQIWPAKPRVTASLSAHRSSSLAEICYAYRLLACLALSMLRLGLEVLLSTL